MIETNIYNLRHHKQYMLKQYLDINELFSPSYVLAGGALKSLFDFQHPKDYDVFIIAFNHQDLLAKKKSIEEKLLKKGYKQVFKCPANELSTFKLGAMKIQIINIGHKLYGTPEEIIDQFDFNLCKMALHCHTLTIDPKAIKDLKTKTLSIHRVTNPASTINRLIKYRKDGYNIIPAILEFCKIFGHNITNQIPMNMQTIYVD